MEVTRILNHRYHPSLKWTDRNKNTGYFSRLKQRIKRFLISLSGDDLTNMLSDVLKKSELANLNNKYFQALSNISLAVNNKKIVRASNKHYFIRPLRNAGFSLKEIKEIGFNCSKDLWSSCLNTNERHLGGKKATNHVLIDEIKNHMENLSNIAANRSVIVKKYAKRNPCILHKRKKISETCESVRYRQTSYYDAFKQFKNPNYNISNQSHNRRMNLGFSTFYKHIDNRFKKPFRCTDLCHYCEFGKDIERELRITIRENGDYNQDFNIVGLTAYFNTKLANCIEPIARQNIVNNIDKVSDLKSIEFHRSIAKRQREAYNKLRLDPILLEGKIRIDIDYKQKIILGQGPRVLNAEFFEANKKKVVCLGFGIYYVETRGIFKFVNCLNIDIISDYDGQNASDMIKIFKFVMQLTDFKDVDKPNYIIWADCGKQFRCAEFIYFLFNDLAVMGKLVNLNFFAEKHGKNMRDQHFSVVSRALQKYTFKNQTRLTSAQEVVNVLNSSSIYINQEKIEQNISVSTSIAAYFNPENDIVQRNKRIISDLNCFYNFQNVQNKDSRLLELYSTVYSDCSLLTPVDSVIDTFSERFRNLQNANENQIVGTTNEERRLIVENNLTNKRKRIDYISKLSKTNGHELNLYETTEETSLNTGSQHIVQDRECQIPVFCIYNCHLCTKDTNYTIEDIKKTNFISQIKINEELSLHRHKKSLIMPRTKKYRNVNEAKVELLAHYKYVHNYF